MLKYMPIIIEKESNTNAKRVCFLNKKENNGGNIVYIISREFRFYDNFALDYAQKLSQEKNKPLIIIFNIPTFESENKTKFFQTEFKKILKDFEANNIECKIFNNKKETETHLKQNNPFFIIKDFDPMEKTISIPKNVPLAEIDGHNICPARFITEKQEYNAATIRRKIYFSIAEFLTEYPNPSPQKHKTIEYFITKKLPFYAKDKNDPTKHVTSDLSKYLNFGFISAQRVVLEVLKSQESEENKEIFLDEIITQKELSDNFCLYCKDYKSFKCIPQWAKDTLNAHREDIRSYLYNLDEFENAKTHDDLWNAAQKQLMKQGKIEGYMRMYWAKMILQWTPTPEDALKTAIFLNDKYGLDAPSPNGYAGILWSIGGLHDRAFIEKPVSGKIRSMTYNGAKSKFDVKKYIESMN